MMEYPRVCFSSEAKNVYFVLLLVMDLIYFKQNYDFKFGRKSPNHIN